MHPGDVADRVAAQDILQETNLTLWRKAEDFELGTSFMAWASRIARYHVLNYRRRQNRDRLVFDERLFDERSERMAERSAEVAHYQESLRACLERLSESQRDLVARRYAAGGSVSRYAAPHPAGQQPRQPLTQSGVQEASLVWPSAEEHVVRSAHDQLILSPAAAKNMQIETMAVAAPTQPIDLPSFQGVLALDNDRLSRIHGRFDGEVVEIGTSTDGSDPTLRVGEKIQRGDLLAGNWSSSFPESSGTFHKSSATTCSRHSRE